MNYCIITVIKNEHEYLDEWISYHLKLGIDKIFIFEDVDSNTHKDITNKYGENVVLNSVFTIYDGKKTHDDVIDMKHTERYYQNRYFLHGIKWIIENYPNEFDWCFAIDNDEFITFEHENETIDQVVMLYQGYDAFMLQWKCYGANGIIYKPDYTNQGLIDIYKKPAEGKLTNSDIGFTKTCYNMRTFKDEFFWNVHQPRDGCKWCKSNLQSFRMRPIYDNIYLRHYMTKSWQEYVEKIKVRGDILKGNRTFDDFFDLNPDMLPQKEELLKVSEDFLRSSSVLSSLPITV